MTKAGRSTFVVAISIILPLSFPHSTRAQQLVAYGTWNGYATYTETDYDPYGNVINQFSQDGSSQLDLDIYATTDPDYAPFYATVTGPPGFLSNLGYLQPVLYGVSFGPTSASGSGFTGALFGVLGDFDVSYLGILPDGQINTTGGFAVADISGLTYPPAGPAAYISFFASFQSVPEPTAIVPMAIGAIVVATAVAIRRRRARKPLARARAAGGLE